MAETHENLLVPNDVTELAEDPAAGELVNPSEEDLLRACKLHPDSLLGWAMLAELALTRHTIAGDIAAYAFARTGYHSGRDALRRHGWRGAGKVPWEHEANRGFLRSLWALSQAAERLGEADEADRGALNSCGMPHTRLGLSCHNH